MVVIVLDWKELFNEELRNLYSSPNVIRMIKSGRMGGSYITFMRSKTCTKIVVGSPEWKRSLLTSRPKWEEEYYRNIV
jgi:hypothetical protein